MGLSGENNVIADALGADMLNIENLLVEKFLGFYNEKPADIKNYIYISWALWAFLVDKQKSVLANHEDGSLPFYGSIPHDVHALTLNYTAFLQERLGIKNVIYFHGGLAEYVRMDTRDLMSIENILRCNPSEFIREIVHRNTDFSSEHIRHHRHVIPALVPPLRLKPILSHKYIELWAKAAQWIKEAHHMVVTGYSFNNADEHFNDILRCNNGRNIDVIAPDAAKPYFKARMEKVFNTPTQQFNAITVQGRPALQSRNIRLIPAMAIDIDIPELFRTSR